jgi:hypothetical protein
VKLSRRELLSVLPNALWVARERLDKAEALVQKLATLAGRNVTVIHA